ncbi:ankyrin repeat domain-containing protein [Legionella taurinensis]|uniref:ankyrin repeat domain-containing protein n=1 Tax=Legionella taurinensis TaxID=70611 RepID=UPI00299F2F0F|nr:ankyrin repeat domain-containing protein [Legionella taurinensis]MDX1837283.1 ankyrin repeat domain-containing protein [Legionella taurinensis]
MGTTTHSISISYDTTTHTWFIANSEAIKKEFLIDGTKDTGQVAEWVYNALVRKDIDECIAFSSTLFADTTTVEAIKETLRKDAAWQAIHDPTRKNCSNLVSYNEVRLLHILVSEAELSTIANVLEYAKKQSTQTNTPSFFNPTHFLDNILNAQDKFGYTPLMFAIDKADFERVELLLQYNPDLNLKNKGTEQSEGQTALELAQHNLKHYRDGGGKNKQLIESYSKIIDTLEIHLHNDKQKINQV